MKKTKKKLDSSKLTDELKDFWYEKLKKSGFEDIEKNEHDFKGDSHARMFSQPVVIRTWPLKTEYYNMASSFLNEYKFESKLEKAIWEYHTEGISMRDIAKLLKKVKTTIKLSKDSVNTIIKRLTKEMKIMYLPQYKDFQ